MFNPKVSIIIPVYNGSNYLEDAIKSALNQTYKNIEVLVINDGSNDNWATEKIALSFDNKIKYIYKENGWVATALNLWIEKANWEYISWLSHDDLYYPNKIEDQINYLNTNYSDKFILSSNIGIINSNSEEIKDVNLNYSSENILFDLLFKSIINWCTLLIPKNAFFIAGNFNTKLKTTQDYNLWFRFIEKWFIFQHIEKKLVKSRVHDQQDSQTKIWIALNERIELEKFVFLTFSEKKIFGDNYKKIDILLLKIKLSINKILLRLRILSKKLRIYSYLSPIWRTYILKEYTKK